MMKTLKIILNEKEWKEHISIPLLEDKYLETGIYNLKTEMRSLGYMNDQNEITLNRNYSLKGFWSNFSYAFNDKILTEIFKKSEEI